MATQPLSNFLEICRAAYARVGLPGTLQSVVDQTGRAGKLITMVNDAHLAIQGNHTRWRFMWSRFSFVTTIGADEYQDTADTANGRAVRDWDQGTMTCQDISIGTSDETEMTYVPWSEFVPAFRVGEIQTDRPGFFSVTPGRRLILDTKADKQYLIEGEFWTRPYSLVENTDYPLLPAEFRSLLVWHAFMQWASVYEMPTGMIPALYQDMYKGLQKTEYMHDKWAVSDSVDAIGSL